MESLDEKALRAFITVVMKALMEKGEKASKWLWKKFRSNLEMPGERKELLENLFLGCGIFLFHPSTDWRPAPDQVMPPDFDKGYPHDLEALRSFEKLLPTKTYLKDNLFFEETLYPTSKLVCAGSPKANAQTRHYLPFFKVSSNGSVRQQYPTCLSTKSIPYCFGENLIFPRVEVISKMMGSKVQKTRKEIWFRQGNTRKEWYPKGYLDGTRLTKDFLLVSKLPRTHEGGDILILAGAHGAGTESIRLLIHDLHINALRTLSDEIGTTPYFQFVLEVTKVAHKNNGTVPQKVKISDKLPPIRLHIDASSLSEEPKMESEPWR